MGRELMVGDYIRLNENRIGVVCELYGSRCEYYYLWQGMCLDRSSRTVTSVYNNRLTSDIIKTKYKKIALEITKAIHYDKDNIRGKEEIFKSGEYMYYKRICLRYTKDGAYAKWAYASWGLLFLIGIGIYLKG